MVKKTGEGMEKPDGAEARQVQLPKEGWKGRCKWASEADSADDDVART